MYSKILLLVLMTLFKIIYTDVGYNEKTFMYYAYGSNLLTRRIHINNPSAVFHNIAKLEDYRLDFNVYSESWHGAAATIVEDPGETVWGDLWTLNISEMKHLDQQEGVDEEFYFAKNVTVITPDGTHVLARTYEEVMNPPKLSQDEILPAERRPSNTYLEVIVLGAVESNLPLEYIAYLNSFPTNGKTASEKIINQLGYPFNITSSPEI